MKGKTVYMVRDGACVEGIFTTREAAEMVIDCGLGDDYVELQLDYGAAEIAGGLAPWRVNVYPENETEDEAAPTDLEGFSVTVARHAGGWYSTSVWAKDEQDAIAKAREMYAQYPTGYPVPSPAKPQEAEVRK